MPRDGFYIDSYTRSFRQQWNARIAERDADLAASQQAAIQGDHELADARRARAVLIEHELQQRFPASFKRYGARRIPLPPQPRFNRRRR